MTQARLDRVLIFGDKLSFLIPHEWIEADDEPGTYLYHAPNAESGWLRVSLITVKNMTSKEKLRELLADRAEREHGQLYESGDNFIAAWEAVSQQDGVAIRQYWWAVGRFHGPGLSREALFSYTILQARKDEPQTQEDISLLGQLVATARFNAPSAA